jgi:hypothetical protein
MELNLFDNLDSTKAIHVYNSSDNNDSRFYVTYGGACYLKGTIEATSGTIAGWNIKKDKGIGVI